MVTVRVLVIVLLATGTALGPFAAGSQAAVESSSTQRAALQALDDVSTNVAQLQSLHANMVALSGKMSGLYRTLSDKVASVGKLAATPGTSQSSLMQATQQMQETQMSFNLQYLQLQESMQQDDQQYAIVSNILKSKYDTMKRVLANIK